MDYTNQTKSFEYNYVARYFILEERKTSDKRLEKKNT